MSSSTHPALKSTLFGPQKWDMYFIIPLTTPCMNNTFHFQKYLQRQVGKMKFLTRRDCSCLMVNTEAQAQAMSILKDLQGNAFPTTPHPHLNSCTGTVVIPFERCPVDNVSWSDWSMDLKELLSDCPEVLHFTSYTPGDKSNRKYPKNFCKDRIQGTRPPTRCIHRRSTLQSPKVYSSPR